MTMTLELNADEHAALASVGGAAGVSLEAVLHGLIAQLSAPVRTEDADTADEEGRREQEEVEANIKRWHREKGRI